jgi:uncharacterized protein YndB with AHSA1/START domain
MNATLETMNGKPVLRFERRLAHSPEKVWKALTDPAELAHWFPQDIEGPFAPGAALRFVFRGTPPSLGGEVITDFKGEVLELDPPRLLSYTWGEDTLRFQLTPDGDGCVLVFTDTLAERGKAARDGAGWHVCLDALDARLDRTTGGQASGAAAGGQAPSDTEGGAATDGAGAQPGKNSWQASYDRYAQAFGPDASTAALPH